MRDKTNMLETDFKIVADDIIRSIMSKKNDIDEQGEESRFIFEFVGSLSIRRDKVDEPEGSSYTESPRWLRKKNATANPNSIDSRCFQ